MNALERAVARLPAFRKDNGSGEEVDSVISDEGDGGRGKYCGIMAVDDSGDDNMAFASSWADAVDGCVMRTRAPRWVWESVGKSKAKSEL